MKYYSEITKNMYDSVDELKNAEEALASKTTERKKDAAEVEKAYNALLDARKNYNEILTKFCEKHGAYHRTIRSTDVDADATNSWDSIAHLLDWLKL